MHTASSLSPSSAPHAASTVPVVTIRELAIGDDSTTFRTLNEEWIARYFTMEEKDRELLSDPENAILRHGGRIFIARCQGEDVGCVALVPMGEGVYELSKMAVKPELRGLGIGRTLLRHAVAEARAAGARSLFLGSNSRLKAAIALYESAGFRHVPATQLPEMHYSRANVFMEMELV
jgi:N-acetylglutamate synthase-like GNAT family acetyltransferase